MELWRYYRIIRGRRWLILACVLVCVCTVGITTYYSPQMWAGRTSVMERQPGPEQGVPVYGDRYMGSMNLEIHLADLGHIIQSKTVLQRSVETLSSLAITTDPYALMRTISVQVVPQTQILRIEVTSEDPEEAKAAADVIAAEFRRFYNEVAHGATTQSREFIEKQLDDSKKKLTEAQRKLKDYKKNTEIVELTQQSNFLLQRLSEIKAQTISADVAEQDAAARMDVTKAQEQSQEEMKQTQETVAQNPLWQQLISQRAKLEAELAGLEATKGRKHQSVMELTEQLEKVKGQLDVTKQEMIVQKGMTNNPIKTNALDRYLNAQSERSASSARRQAYQQALSELEQEMDQLPEREMRLAELTLDVKAAESTYNLLRSKLDEAKIKERESINASAIKVIEPAYSVPADKKLKLKLMLAFLLSPLLGIGLAFLLNYLDNTIKTPSEAEELLGLPVFSVVPLGRNHSLARRPDSPALSAAYQMLSTQLWQAVKQTGKSTVVVASAEPDAGRSTTAANLAITLAADGSRVILVDADMRKPSLHLMFGADNKRGFSNLLSGTATIEDTAMPTKYENLLLIPSGPIPDNPVRLLRRPQMQSFIEQINSLADFVIFDTPAGVTFTDASLVAAYAHNVVIAYSAGRVPRGAEAEFRSRLEHVDANLIGAALNRVRPEDSHGYFHYRKSYQEVLPPRNGKSSGGMKAIPASKSDMDSDL